MFAEGIDEARLTVTALTEMEFPQRLATIRKQKGLTQQALADMVGVHVTQLRRYEGGRSEPTMLVLKKLAIALSVSLDVLAFDQDERGPDEALRLQFEAAQRLGADEKHVLMVLIEGILLQHQHAEAAHRLAQVS